MLWLQTPEKTIGKVYKHTFSPCHLESHFILPKVTASLTQWGFLEYISGRLVLRKKQRVSRYVHLKAPFGVLLLESLCLFSH